MWIMSRPNQYNSSRSHVGRITHDVNKPITPAVNRVTSKRSMLMGETFNVARGWFVVSSKREY